MLTKPSQNNNPTSTKSPIKKLRKMSFQNQLALIFLISVILFSIIGSASITYLDWSRSYSDLISHGNQLTKDLARRSSSSLLYDITENISEDVGNTLNYPTVIYVSISDKNNNIVIQRWNNELIETSGTQLTHHDHEKEMYDTGDYIHFNESVLSKNKTDMWSSPFSAIQEPPELLGIAHLVISKKQFNEKLYSTFLVNSVTFLTFSSITLAILLILSRRISKPLNKLSAVMHETKEGKLPDKVDISGSIEIDNMVEAFNSMLRTLDERAKNLDDKNKQLMLEIDFRKSAENDRTTLQKQLLQAQKMEAIGQLTGGIAHDFNNILAAVLGYCQLAIRLTEKNPDEKLNKYLCEIKKGGERARELVSQLLSFSRKKGRDTSDHSLTAVAPIISEVTAMLSSIIPSSIEVHENISTETPDIAVDPVQLHQAILNLCINARDAMNGKGELTITVSHENTNMICSSCHHSFHGSYVSIGVKDSGSGIPDSIKDKLFEPFFTTKDIGKGSGMGLAMVHGIVHNHHGHLTVESEENIGTTFKLHFPVKTRTLDQQRVA